MYNIINWKYEAYFRFFFIQGSEEGNSAQLGLANLGGVFIVLLGGVIVSCLLALCEYMWEARRLVRDKEVFQSFYYVSNKEAWSISIDSKMLVEQLQLFFSEVGMG